jgi:hypothetical protein
MTFHLNCLTAVILTNHSVFYHYVLGHKRWFLSATNLRVTKCPVLNKLHHYTLVLHIYNFLCRCIIIIIIIIITLVVIVTVAAATAIRCKDWPDVTTSRGRQQVPPQTPHALRPQNLRPCLILGSAIYIQTYGPNNTFHSYILIIIGLKLVQLLQVALFC